MGLGEPQSGRAMTEAERKDALRAMRAEAEAQPTNPDGSAIPTPATSGYLQVADPDTTLEGVPFVHDHTNADGTEWAPLGVVDVFVVDVEFAQDRAYGPSPTFDTYDEARAVGVDLLKNHADARSFSVRKSTILR